MFGRTVQMSLVKNPSPTAETVISTVDPDKIEEIARRSVLDLTKLGIVAAGTLMTLASALRIIESHAKKE